MKITTIYSNTIYSMNYIKVRDVKSPERGTPKSAGIDFFVPNDYPVTTIRPGSDLLIPSGIKMAIKENYMLMAADKSGVVTSSYAVGRCGRTPKPGAFGSVVIIGAKIVDEDYQGEIHIHLINVGSEVVTIKPGMKISQFILVPVSYDELNELQSEEELFPVATERGDGALGSTGS